MATGRGDRWAASAILVLIIACLVFINVYTERPLGFFKGPKTKIHGPPAGRGTLEGEASACTDNDGDYYITESLDIANCGNVCGPVGTEPCKGNNDCDDVLFPIGCGADCSPGLVENDWIDGYDNDCDTEIDEYYENPFILTYWGAYIDVLSETEWQEYLDASNELRDLGFTHAGIHILRTDANETTDVLSRIAELRAADFDIALHQSSGHRILKKKDELDPENHPTNNQNLKYFDAPGFDPYSCACGCDPGDGVCCSNTPSDRAHDPAYNGVVWQKELAFLDDLMDWSGITSHDMVIFDTEIWGTKPRRHDPVCYENAINHSVSRYSGTLEERYDQFYIYWRERGLDLRRKVKERDQGIMTLFYHEDLPERCREDTWIPAGVGDAASPYFYHAPNLTRFQQELDKADYNNSYAWASYTQTNTYWTDLPGDKWVLARWDPKISQKMGYMLREEGFAGVIIFSTPGPGEENVGYFLNHSEAFVDGYINGIDPGELTEICGDSWDNDGDGEFDEPDCVRCVDLEGEVDYFRRGVVRYNDVHSPDNCWSSQVLHEWYCDGDNPIFIVYQCPTSCEDGACIHDPCIESGGVCQIETCLLADLDDDFDVDGTDFLNFSMCFNGSLNPPAAGCLAPNADIDGDGDVDGTDFISFATCFNGSLNHPRTRDDCPTTEPASHCCLSPDWDVNPDWKVSCPEPDEVCCLA